MSDDHHTERRHLDIAIAELMQRFASFEERYERDTEHTREWRHRLNEFIIGDGTTGKPGLMTRVDRLEQGETHRKIIYTGLLGLFVEHIRHIFLGKG